jgi:hypothetical protein
MTSRNSTRSHTSRSSTEAPSGQEAQVAGESVRQQFGLITQGAESVLRTAEVWQQAQLQLTQRTRSSYRDAAARMGQATNPAELISIQAGLLLSGMQQAMQFGVEVMTGTMAQQSEAGPAAQQAFGTGGAPVNAGLAAMAPMVQAWQSMFTPPGDGASSTTH